MKNETSKPRGRPRTLDKAKALEVALDLFWRHGYEGTSVSDLTAAMGATPPSLYAAFGSKEALYREALDLYASREGDLARQALEEAHTARDGVRLMLDRAARAYAANGERLGCLIASSVLSCSREHQTVRDELARRRQAACAMITARLDRAVGDGELPEGTDTRSLATFFGAVIQGMSTQARDGATLEDLASVAALAMRAWPT
ncbi:MAG TPA: TetR/AcrR family transcriptional regulator [Magnetospirillum sp.]|nr:TetR/AcrR family transcriptional regulator [Magnetospirillum sp.]